MRFDGILKQLMLLIMAFLLVASVRETGVKAGSFPLPNIFNYPHIKNQSLVYCGDEFDPTISVTYFPKGYNCRQRKTMVIRFTPKLDVFSTTCHIEVYKNNILVVNDIKSDLCSRRSDIRCPLLKGETQQIEGGLRMPCEMAKAHYQFKSYCTNQDEVTSFCLNWSFTWV
ncbi:uncharacterized protein LOC116294089 [Actinia tenebrosa]|uniref:Uncharacterized protein LOC116294089 n=1 Tax=Actinia tenebrosa TaxID=6105 RepID=A0A6P8HXT2_ACTTE|nr:uncharacterized protein LOC116294089 [Actinia tenebrosa]